MIDFFRRIWKEISGLRITISYSDWKIADNGDRNYRIFGNGIPDEELGLPPHPDFPPPQKPDQVIR